MKELDIERDDKKVAEDIILVSENEHAEKVIDLETRLNSMKHDLEKSSSRLVEKNEMLNSIQKKYDDLIASQSSQVELSEEKSKALIEIEELKKQLKLNEELLTTKDSLLEDLRSQLSIRSSSSSEENSQIDALYFIPELNIAENIRFLPKILTSNS